jgi:hypothetical protein
LHRVQSHAGAFAAASHRARALRQRADAENSPEDIAGAVAAALLPSRASAPPLHHKARYLSSSSSSSSSSSGSALMVATEEARSPTRGCASPLPSSLRAASASAEAAETEAATAAAHAAELGGVVHVYVTHQPLHEIIMTHTHTHTHEIF